MASVETVTEWLRDAVRAVKDANVPSALQPIAMSKAFDALAGTVTAAGGERDGGRRGAGGNGKDTDTSTPTGRIAADLGVDPDNAADVYDVTGNELHLTITRNQLAEARGDAVREVAILVAAGRQAAGLDEERTHTNDVRDQVVELGILNKNTFIAEMRGLGNVVTQKTAGRGRDLKITRHGKTEAARIIKRITAGTQ